MSLANNGTVQFLSCGSIVICLVSMIISKEIKKGIITKICDVPENYECVVAVISGVTITNQSTVPVALGIIQLDKNGLFINSQIDITVNHRIYSNIAYMQKLT